MTKENGVKPSGFHGLGIAPKLLEVLDKLGFSEPTPIQKQSIPTTIEGKDVVGIAQTGTGKTLAFGVPMLQRLAREGGRGLVVLPTRELAQQVDEHLNLIGGKIGLRTAVLIGGEPIGIQLKRLSRRPHIIIATPGRLIDHIKRRSVELKSVKILVLDEADMMFDMGFMPQIREVLAALSKDRQTMLFSATMPPAIMKIVVDHMKMPVRIEVAPQGTPAENVAQEMIVVASDQKIDQLEKILKETKGSVLVFSRTKHGAKRLCHKLNMLGFKSEEIHSDRSLGQRQKALKGFKDGLVRILVATDIAARGIDVRGIELVVNFDLPTNSEDYVHRIGRTGRAGQSGKAVSFVIPGQAREVKKIESLINQRIPLIEISKLELPKAPFGQRRKKFTVTRSSGSRNSALRSSASVSSVSRRPVHGNAFRPSPVGQTDRQRFLSQLKGHR